MSKNLLSLLLAVASFALYYLIINPIYSGVGSIWQPEHSIKDLQALNRQYDDAIAQADTLKTQATALQADYAKVSDDDKQKMKIMVPDSIDKVRFLDEVSNMIEDAGFSAKTLNVAEGGTGDLPAYTVSFNVKSNYDNFKSLMDVFEKSMRLYSVQSVNFTTSNEGLTTYNATLSTYYLKK